MVKRARLRLLKAGFREGRLQTTRKWHCFNGSRIAMCGFAHWSNCNETFEVTRTGRSGLISWPNDDLNWCGACRRALAARGELAEE